MRDLIDYAMETGVIDKVASHYTMMLYIRSLIEKGAHKKAEQLLRIVWEVSRKYRKRFYKEVSAAYHELAVLFNKLRKYKEAILTSREAIKRE